MSHTLKMNHIARRSAVPMLELGHQKYKQSCIRLNRHKMKLFIYKKAKSF